MMIKRNYFTGQYWHRLTNIAIVLLSTCSDGSKFAFHGTKHLHILAGHSYNYTVAGSF
jgi:hypothetical protein